ncbi:hypothetical protein H9Q70_002439 [Fusarium xylarioides]|nr:hypothetical protein H9Q70_002439 [Fusarium xylarioides]
MEELEIWRLSVPESLRPGLRLRSHRLGQPQALYLAVHIHFSYYNVRIALFRVCVLAWAQDSEEQMRYKLLLAESARSIIDLVHFIDLEPFVLPWVQYNMPQAALFVLFDFIIENPSHSETRKNLSYMQIATSYFMRLQYATGNMVFGTILTQFLEIATKFLEGPCLPSITQPDVSANQRGLELWDNLDSGVGTTDYEESIGLQALQLPIHNGFEFQDMDLWLTESEVLSFLESNADFGLPNPESEGQQEYLENKFPGYDLKPVDVSKTHGQIVNNKLNMPNAFIKTILDQTIGAAVNTFLLCVFINFLKSAVVPSVPSGYKLDYATIDWLNIIDKAYEDFFPLLVAGWKLWPAVSFISFTVLRTVKGRNLFVALASVVWGIYLSWLGVE